MGIPYELNNRSNLVLILAIEYFALSIGNALGANLLSSYI